MKWRWQTVQEKRDAKRERLSRWHRKFAWTPKHDPDSRIAYWMQFVWRRCTRFYGDDDQNYYGDRSVPFVFEYRDGKNCPEVKQPPSHLKEVA